MSNNGGFILFFLDQLCEVLVDDGVVCRCHQTFHSSNNENSFFIIIYEGMVDFLYVGISNRELQSIFFIFITSNATRYDDEDVLALPIVGSSDHRLSGQLLLTSITTAIIIIQLRSSKIIKQAPSASKISRNNASFLLTTTYICHSNKRKRHHFHHHFRHKERHIRRNTPTLQL